MPESIRLVRSEHALEFRIAHRVGSDWSHKTDRMKLPRNLMDLDVEAALKQCNTRLAIGAGGGHADLGADRGREDPNYGASVSKRANGIKKLK
jgi:hypothetical protein